MRTFRNFGLLVGGATATLVAGLPASAQEIGTCGQLAAQSQVLREPLNPGFDERSRTVSIARSEARYVEFTLGAPQPLFARTIVNGPGDPILSLFDSTGGVVGYDDDGAGDLNSVLRLDLGAGTYCAQVRLHGAEPAAADVALILSTDGAGFPAPPADGDQPRVSPCLSGGLAGDLASDVAPGTAGISVAAGVNPDLGASGWRMTVSAPVALQLDAMSSEMDTVMTVYDAAGNAILENDDHPEAAGSDSRLVELFQPGEYCVGVRPYDASGGGSFTLAMSEAPPDATLGGGAIAGAPAGGCGDFAALSPIATGLSAGFGPASVSGDTGPAGRADYLLTLAEALDLKIDAMSDSFDTVLSVYGPDGTLLYENDDHPDTIGSNSRLVEALPPGDYCVSVRGYSGGTGPYAIEISQPGPNDVVGGGGLAGESGPACADPAEVQEFASDLVSGFAPVAVNAQISQNTGHGEFHLSLAEPLAVTLDAGSGAFDTVLNVFDSAGNLVYENDDGPNGTNSQVSDTLPAGDYCVVVRGFGGEVGPFSLTLAAQGETANAAAGLSIPADPAAIEDLGALADRLQSQGLTRDPVLWTTFTTDRQGPVRIQGVSMSSGFVLALVDEDGTMLDSASSSGGVANAALRADLPPGRYYAVLSNDYPDTSLQVRQITVERE